MKLKEHIIQLKKTAYSFRIHKTIMLTALSLAAVLYGCTHLPGSENMDDSATSPSNETISAVLSPSSNMTNDAYQDPNIPPT